MQGKGRSPVSSGMRSGCNAPIVALDMSGLVDGQCLLIRPTTGRQPSSGLLSPKAFTHAGAQAVHSALTFRPRTSPVSPPASRPADFPQRPALGSDT